jgi:hypothetical protein
MSRLLLAAGVLALGFLAASWAGDNCGNATDTKRVALEDELRRFLQDHGPTHPDVVGLKERIALLTADGARGEEINPKGLLVVLSKENFGATLKGARIRSFGGRPFVVGLEVKGPNITKPRFVGSVVWIPLNDVIQMVEVEEPKEK